MEITWFGHSNFRIEDGDTTILIDPFFVGNPAAPTSHSDIEKVDLILVTHDHSDHIGQTLELAAKHDAEVVAVFDTIQSLIVQGLPESLGVGMNIGGTVERCGVSIKMVQAMHSSATGMAAGFILTFPNDFCIYNSGDTGLFSSMGLFGAFNDINLAMLPIGGRFTMDAKEAAFATRLVAADKVMPMHWGTWPILDKNTEAFAEALAETAPDAEMVLPVIGERVKVD